VLVNSHSQIANDQACTHTHPRLQAGDTITQALVLALVLGVGVAALLAAQAAPVLQVRASVLGHVWSLGGWGARGDWLCMHVRTCVNARVHVHTCVCVRVRARRGHSH